MRNQEHCQATKSLLGLSPHRELHAYMDAFSKTMAWGHRMRRHDYAFVQLVTNIYGQEGRLVAGLHIACDMGLVTNADVAVWERLVGQHARDI